MTEITDNEYKQLVDRLDALSAIVLENYDENTQLMESFVGLLKGNGESSLEMCEAIKKINENASKATVDTANLGRRIKVLAKRQVDLDNRLLKHAQVIHINKLKTPDHGGEL